MNIELDYVKVGDYCLPHLTAEPYPTRGLGKYAHLREVEDAANDLLDGMMPGMAKAAGATEELKARDPMRWVGLMNCRKAQVEEIIFVELVYC